MWKIAIFGSGALIHRIAIEQCKCQSDVIRLLTRSIMSHSLSYIFGRRTWQWIIMNFIRGEGNSGYFLCVNKASDGLTNCLIGNFPEFLRLEEYFSVEISSNIAGSLKFIATTRVCSDCRSLAMPKVRGIQNKMKEKLVCCSNCIIDDVF